jgi:competence protein ComFB
MEDIVRSCLKELIQHKPIDGCDETMQSDIIAIALNRLPPKYVSTAKGEVFVKTQTRLQVEPDVYRELSLAIEKVTQSERRSDFTSDAE